MAWVGLRGAMKLLTSKRMNKTEERTPAFVNWICKAEAQSHVRSHPFLLTHRTRLVQERTSHNRRSLNSNIHFIKLRKTYVPKPGPYYFITIIYSCISLLLRYFNRPSEDLEVEREHQVSLWGHHCCLLELSIRQ